MPINVATVDLRKLDSATRYPSILTLHRLGERGRLLDDLQVTFASHFLWTEKVDGTNCRIIITDDFDHPIIVGSREELLWAHGDLLHSPVQRIVEAVQPLISPILTRLSTNEWTAHRGIENGFLVLYGEVYGGDKRVGPAYKAYTETGTLGFRMFDAAIIPTSILDKPIEEIASWRDNHHQPFLPWHIMTGLADFYSLPAVPELHTTLTVPREMSVETMHQMMLNVADRTRCALDGDGGRLEGFVLRTSSGSKMAKVRFADYERTLNVRPTKG